MDKDVVDFYPSKYEKISKDIQAKLRHYHEIWGSEWYFFQVNERDELTESSLKLAKYLRRTYKSLFQLREWKPSLMEWNKLLNDLKDNTHIKMFYINKDFPLFTIYNLVYIHEPAKDTNRGILIFVDTEIDYIFVNENSNKFPASWYEFKERMGLLSGSIRYLYKDFNNNEFIGSLERSQEYWPYRVKNIQKLI